MKSGVPIIDNHPHPAFVRLKTQGYEFFYRFRGEEDLLDLDIEVRKGDQVVGTADFSDDGPYAHCQNVQVKEAYQRQGIATAMYMFAECALGKKLHDFWKGDPLQTKAARALWDMPNRPFGHRDAST